MLASLNILDLKSSQVSMHDNILVCTPAIKKTPYFSIFKTDYRELAVTIYRATKKGYNI